VYDVQLMQIFEATQNIYEGVHDRWPFERPLNPFVSSNALSHFADKAAKAMFV
jgi:hypothetical protein